MFLFLCLVAVLGGCAVAFGDTQSALDSVTGKTNQLRSSIQSDDANIQRYQPRLDELQTELSSVEADLSVQEQQLATVQGQLRESRAHLTELRAALVRDKAALADQLRAQYESPQLNMMTVVLHAKGFADLMETGRSMRRIQENNTAILQRVKTDTATVTAETQRLTGLEKTEASQTASILSHRDEVAALREEVLNQQSVFVRSKASKQAALDRLEAQRKRLADRLATLQARAAGYNGPVSLGGAYAPHGGAYGFFQAPGTNYSVGDEPTIAAHLDAMGKALSLHLIGISGYRTPEHSVEVGGFPNDPHTRGEASDTPGVEGVPESTLNQFGLTRPFGGAAEADHIQLVGSI
jgi:peptidoglycan hydrolase CwlO-like protein